MCLFIHRWHQCPQEKNLPQIEPSECSDPQRPWIDWKHGELIPDDYRNVLCPGFVWVRHRVISKVRCASWDTRACDAAPRELFIRVFKTACSECTGGDLGCASATPIATEHITHDQLIQTDEQSSNMDIAVSDYWRGFVRTQASIFRAAFNGFPDQPPLLNHNRLTGVNQDTYQLYASSACTECAEHVGFGEFIPHSCRSCACTFRAAGHNLLRCMMKTETGVAAHNEGMPFLHRLSWLEGQGFLTQMKLSRRQNRMPQEPITPRFILDQPAAPRSYSEILKLIRDELISIGPIIEDSLKRQHDLRLEWREIIQFRFAMAVRFILLIYIDGGLSREFKDRLFDQHISGMLCPWVRLKEAGDHERLGRLMLCWPPGPAPETESFVSGIDQFDHRQRSKVRADVQQEQRLRSSLNLVREAMHHNLGLTERAATTYIAHLSIISGTEAISREEYCVLCGDGWFGDTNVPEHMRAVAAPCCKKPYHLQCWRRLLTLDPDRKVSCPMCRDDLVESQGWFRRSPGFVERWKHVEPHGRGFLKPRPLQPAQPAQPAQPTQSAQGT